MHAYLFHPVYATLLITLHTCITIIIIVIIILSNIFKNMTDK